jgi:signal transduction histidine kinase
VLLNLLSNAAKFVPAPGGQVEVRLTPMRAASRWRCRTTARACRPGQQQLIFEKFRQGGDGANRPQGTGLGLPISRQIVEHFGGRHVAGLSPGKVPASPSLPCHPRAGTHWRRRPHDMT